MPFRVEVSRRALLKQGAAVTAALAAPMFIPASARGADGHVAPSNKITMGCIGVGGQGNGNMGAFLGQPDVRVVAVADVDDKHAGNAANNVNGRYKDQGCFKTRDFREVLARTDIDAISMATPDHWHALIAVMAAKSGKDCYGEKPLTHDLLEGRALVEAFKKYGRVWQTGSQQRSSGEFRQACELALNGRLGKVHTVEVGLPTGGTGGSEQFTDAPKEMDYDFWIGPAPYAPYSKDRTHWNWRWQLDYGGGQLMDWIGHHADIAQWGMGTNYTGPVEITPDFVEFPREGLYTAATKYRYTSTYKNGVKLVIGNDSKDLRGGCKFIGDKGWVWVNRGAIQAEPIDLLKEKIGPGEIQLFRSPGHHRNFVDCCKSRKLTICPAEVSHRSASLGHLGLICLQLGRKIRWNPDTETILDDPSATAMLGRAKREPWNLYWNA